ncbi:porin family protein [uncultured Algibacter sp.]|uniref:porin family protein n=1 Tax=uncultured Algibacter sp. TaxID=298659 RepID=UPI00321668D6
MHYSSAIKHTFICFLFVITNAFAQEHIETNKTKATDSLYREDQFYAGITYNLLGKQPEGLSQSGFSLGFHLGFIRDMPINKARNMAIGIGLGYSANSYNQNLLIVKDDSGQFNYNLLSDSNTYTKNKFSSHLIEVPLEFRWRRSTPSDYDFWRIYTGFKFGYKFAQTSKHVGDLGVFKYTKNDDFNKFQYGLTLSAGYNTWNIYVYYALNSIFTEDAQLEGSNIDLNAVKIGLIFYIL